MRRAARARPHSRAFRNSTGVVVGTKPNPTSPTYPRRGGSPRTPTQTRRPIYFYDKKDPYYCFTNFSSHHVYYDNKRYPTSEHLYQSFKFLSYRPEHAKHIRTYSERPSVAFSEARRLQAEIRPDWKHINIQVMDLVLWHKFTQHESLKKELLSTGNAELIEDSDKDSFWGIGADRRGRNELGKALMRLRTSLRPGVVSRGQTIDQGCTCICM